MTHSDIPQTDYYLTIFPNPEIQLLDPAFKEDREMLYRRFRASLPTHPVERDDSHARQAQMVGENMTYKYWGAQGRWYDGLYSYLKDGHSVNIRDYRGKTPLHHALDSKYDKQDKVRQLVEAGADVTMRDFQDQTPVDVAMLGDDTALVVFLLRT
jgi:hypothetical protein